VSVSNDDVCVSVRDVSKKFSRSLKRSFVYGARDIGRLLIGRGADEALRPSEFWAVRNVSFDLQRGKSIGIVGLNGSGKTTLLRMISGILRPTVGEIVVNGRIAPMLALGAGFKPVLSGRQNVFLNLSLLGVPERQIRERFDSIVDFAELNEAIDAPLGTYSSGMQARLGFACAVHTDPKIMVVDEVLAVGDTRFRMKCRNRINELRRDGTSMLLVSHSSVLVETLSDECIYMRKGKVAARGAPAEVMRAYDADGAALAVKRVEEVKSVNALRAPQAGQNLSIVSIEFATKRSDAAGFLVCGLEGELTLHLQATEPIDGISINVMVFDLTHQPGETVLFIMSSRDLGSLGIVAGPSQVKLKFPYVGLRPGTYRVKVSVSHGAQHDLVDCVDNLRLVVRDAGRAANNLYYQSRSWECLGGAFAGPHGTDSDREDFDADFA
jgi:lipopolysaccharide transport system ATP-binding protein